MAVQDNPELRKIADALWERYASAVRYGGTPLQVQTAFRRALDAEDVVIRERWLAGGRLVAAGAYKVGEVVGKTDDGHTIVRLGD